MKCTQPFPCIYLCQIFFCAGFTLFTQNFITNWVFIYFEFSENLGVSGFVLQGVWGWASRKMEFLSFQWRFRVLEHIASSSSGHHQAWYGSAPEGDEAAHWLLIVRHGLAPGGDEAARPVQDQHGSASGGDEAALGLLKPVRQLEEIKLLF